MLRKWLFCLVVASFVISLNGCASSRKQKELEIQGLRNQISALESQLQTKDEEINSLKEAAAKATEEKETAVSKKKVIGEIKSRPTPKQIQIALRNAGYNPGKIDGRMGKLSHEAIKAFQKAHNLTPDGKMGKETWNLLKEYLYKKSK
jgi:peptidoglycan hydrolase-like protein with peptidoglycan-binding domain